MQPVLRAAQVREADAHTIANEPIRSIDLMERAATVAFDWIFQHAPGLLFPKNGHEADWRFTVCCGTGNNGGDGLVIARLLARSGYDVKAIVLRSSVKGSPDFEENLKRARKAKVDVLELAEDKTIPELDGGSVVIDALFGIGLSKSITGACARLVEAINGSGAVVVSIDLPSGLLSEGCMESGATVVRADHTLTFQVPKLAFFFRENAAFIGQWHVLPIDLDQDFIQALPTPWQCVENDDVSSWLPVRTRFAHKGDHGHALIVAGSRVRMGAALLTLGGCSRSGAGLVTGHIPGSGLAALNSLYPEVMADPDTDGDLVTQLPRLERCTAVGVGPGIGTGPRTATLLKLLIQEARCPLVLDADALNILAENPTWLAFLPPGAILTPHPREFDRLAGPSADSAERLQKATELAVKYCLHVVLKGAFTALCGPTGAVLFNPTGNPGMAKGGSGDVLTGLLTGLLAQGLPPDRATALGVYLHGLAGDLAARSIGMDGMAATDLIAHLPAAWKQLRG